MVVLRRSILPLFLALGLAMPASAQALKLASDAPRPLVFATSDPAPRAARPPVELVTDGSFEGGSPNTAWASTSDQTPPVSPFCTLGICGGPAPRTGDWHAFLGGVGTNESMSVSQTITIPADATSALLTFYLQLGVGGDATGQFGFILDSTPILAYTQDDVGSFADYTVQTVDLSAFADGQPHTLGFVAIEVAGTEQGAFFSALVDDVSLIAEVPSTTGGNGPVNDFLFAAAPIAAPDTFVTVSSVGADAEDGDFNPAASCVSTGSDGNNALWWAFLATGAGSVEAMARGVGADPVDTIVSVLTLGEDGTLTEVACNDDTTTGNPDDGSRTAFDVTPGTRYFVRVTGFNGEEGDLVVGIGGASGLVRTYVTGAHNDNLGFSPGALQFSRVPADYPDTNVGATEETNEALASCVGDGNDGRNSVWRIFVSPANASVTLDLEGSTFDTILSVYRSDGVSLVEEVACNDDAGDGIRTSRVTFDATANTIYAVRTVGFNGDSGAILYGLEVAPATAAESGTGATASRLAVAPNPIASSAQVNFTVGTAQPVRVGLYDLLGREVRTLHDAPVVAGQPTTLRFETAGLAPGVYVVRAWGPEVHLAERVTVLR
ncbi:MAG: T9SS type A sorting domain-containing protein [Bacteroidota bacterium]